MSKIIVFGGDGFIGRHIVKRLAEKDNDDIVVFDRFSSYQAGADHPFNDFTNVSIVPGNFFNRDEVNDVLQDVDYVFHLISSTNPATSHNDPLIDIDTNMRSSVELFQACVENNVKKVIFFSSGGAVYGDIDDASISEGTVPQPLSPYGIGKLTIEHYLQYFKHSHGLEYMVYRIANPYGPGQNIHGKQGVIPIFMRKFVMKEPLTVFGDGTMQRDYIYIDDLSRLIVESYQKNNKHAVYNIGCGSGVTVNQLIDAIESYAGFSIPIENVETPSSYVQSNVLSINRFVDEFGIKPQTSLETGIMETWNYVKDITD